MNNRGTRRHIMEKVNVTLDERSYLITIAKGLFDSAVLTSLFKPKQRAMIVTNETIAPLYLQQVSNALKQYDIDVDQVILADGEKYKSLDTVNTIYSVLLKNHHGRDTTLIALGGGVIGDMTGFAAATYQRGVRFIQLPTTLLSQVDSSVGGKTGVNHHLGKNMIGAFYQPASVIIDINCLKTLPKKEFCSGLAEVIKYGIILDEVFFCWLEQNIGKLMALETDALAYCIRRCCELKALIVAKDEHEHDARALLNLGHTFGHAIETKMGYGNWLHGEAVAAGIVMAAELSRLLGKLTTNEFERIKRLLQCANLPIIGPKEMNPNDYLPYMLRDKKVLNGQLRLIIPTTIGKSVVKSTINHDIILTAIENCMSKWRI